MITVELPDGIKKWQTDLLHTYQANPEGKWIVTKSRRQVGKSVCLELLLTVVAVNHPGSTSLVCSPVISQSRKIFKELKMMCWELLTSSNESTLTLDFISGSSIEFVSAEQGDAIRGRTVKKGGILCIDEASYIADDFFYDVLLPTTNVFNATIVITSTPRFKQGFFFELFTKGKLGENPKVISVDWNEYDTSDFLSAETLELYRQQMPARAFRSEYLAEFIDGDSVVFGDYRKCFGKPQRDSREELLIGIDWGTGIGEDDTAVTIGQMLDGKIQIQRILHFNDKGTNQTIDYLLTLVKGYVSEGFTQIQLVVEKNSIGQVYYSALFDAIEEWESIYNDSVSWNKEIAVDMAQFITTNASKKRIIEQLSSVLENGRAVICDCPKLDNELSIYACKVDSKGLVTYNAPSGFHDDLVMSLAFVVDRYFPDL